MAQLPMYAAAVNSPSTELAADITATDTEITVLDASKLPASPNLVTVGGDETAETIMYAGKTGNTLTGCTRGFEGTAKGWAAGSPAARNHTAYDYEAGRANIADLDERVSNIVIPDGTTTQKGIVQLSDAADGTRSTVAATEKAVNDARLAAASDATTKADAVQTALDNHANSNAATAEPHGMRVRSGKLEYYNGSGWAEISSGIDLTTNSIIYYVNASTGNDSNDGLSSAQAFKTISKALTVVPDVFNNSIVINVAEGSYIENVNIYNKFGSGSLTIQGPSSGSPAIISGRIEVSRSGLPNVSLNYLTINPASGVNSVSAVYARLLRVNSCTMTATTSQAGIIASYTDVETYNCVISNKSQAIRSSSLSRLFSINVTGAGNATGLYADAGGLIIKTGTQPSGTTAEFVTAGGLIRS